MVPKSEAHNRMRRSPQACSSASLRLALYPYPHAEISSSVLFDFVKSKRDETFSFFFALAFDLLSTSYSHYNRILPAAEHCQPSNPVELPNEAAFTFSGQISILARPPLLRGLKYLHSANILHRDLKPGNLLINANCDLKICDFGLARTSNGQGQFMTEYVVTRWYRAPELLLCCDNYGTSIDVWSVGCIFAELLGRKPVFPGSECLNQLKLIVNVLGTMNDSDLSFIDNSKARKYIKSLPYSPGISFSSLYPHADPLAIDLLQKMLVFDPSKRISVIEALQHPYMSPLYDPSTNPPADVPVDIEVDEDLGENMIREMMWNEMHFYHADDSSLNVRDIME
ncbi:mitogen-activated protein kinase homolog NTF3-like [Dendrobium catenatum]|uniref:mitogen-activated protein kinase homolog NTF3-like n=1 Tax=Dendrobium catenatum TaxID=906689 RepID=UPI0009F31488|nr:mitogen-activated protein kinase homolog NTF3-like [Dendrobium catenatum]